jgi:hypothetical protein
MEAKLLAVVVIAFGQFIYAIGIVVSLLLFMEKREELAKGKVTEAKVSRRWRFFGRGRWWLRRWRCKWTLVSSIVLELKKR